ncbi:MAG: hypothetical protein GC152_06270 [Alphaproteobacteria bacterium]|nr:hypothetical protein [Alphaproteobacteria bacterium]
MATRFAEPSTRTGWRSPTFLADAATLALGAVFLAFAVRYAFAQSIWIDETTQLSGAGLPFRQMLDWLMGREPQLFVVPDDRMPPLSYVIDWGWRRLAGDAPIGFRLLHLAILAAGVGYLALHVRKAFGPAPAAFLVAFFALSPKIIEAAVEIRAYPIFLALTAASLVPFLRMTDESWAANWRNPALFGVLCVLNIYTHFFAVLAAASLYGALIVRRIGDGPALKLILASGFCAAIASAGILPFALAASDLTATGEPGTASMSDIALFVPRVFLAPASFMFPAAAAAIALGAAIIALSTAVDTLVRRQWTLAGPRGPLFALALAAVLGVVVTVAANVAQDKLVTVNPSYARWLYPVVAACLAACLATPIAEAGPGGRLAATRTAGAGLAILGLAISAAVLMTKPGLFIHGPGDALIAIIEAEGEDADIVYEHGQAFGYAAFPVRWRFGDSAPQWIAEDPGGEQFRLFATGRDAIPATATDETVLLGDEIGDRIIVVEVRLQSVFDLRRGSRQPDKAETPMPPEIPAISRRLSADPAWRLARTEEFGGLYAARVRVFERAH